MNNVARNEQLIELVKSERESNNNLLSEYEKNVIKYNIDQKRIIGDTEIVFHTQNALAISGFPTTVEEVLEFCKKYKHGFNTDLSKIAMYTQESKGCMNEWHNEKLQEYYSRVMTQEEALKIVTRERLISLGLSGFEKAIIDRFLQNQFRYRPDKEEVIFALLEEFKSSGFPTTRTEIEAYILECKEETKISATVVGVIISILLICLGMFLKL